MKNTIKAKKKKSPIKTKAKSPRPKPKAKGFKVDDFVAGWSVNFDNLLDVFKQLEDGVSDKWIADFAVQSNEIEGIRDQGSHEKHKVALIGFLKHKTLTLKNIERFTFLVAGKNLRTSPTDMVSIGGRVAPKPTIMLPQLDKLIEKINMGYLKPYEAHFQYEYLHPFLDGNGRSGRAIWLWQMVKFRNWQGHRSFLHEHYYQSLSYLSSIKDGKIKMDGV